MAPRTEARGATMGRGGGEEKERKDVCAESEEEKDLNIWII